MRHGVSRADKHDQEVTVLRRSKFGEKYVGFWFLKEKKKTLRARPQAHEETVTREKQGGLGRPPALSHAWVGRAGRSPYATEMRSATRTPEPGRAVPRGRDPAPRERSFLPPPSSSSATTAAAAGSRCQTRRAGPVGRREGHGSAASGAGEAARRGEAQ